MKKLISLMLVTFMLSALLIPAAMAAGAGYYYVKTDNGKSLNVRNNPDGKVLGSLPYGTRVYVEEFVNSGKWARIYYQYQGGEYAAFLSARYLVNYNPGSYTPSATASPASASSVDAAKALSDMNAEFKTGRLVPQQFNVYARPSRASGWVNLRWAPSLEAERIATCPQGKVLTVIGETRSWYQVRDPETGMIGFISKQYVSAR